MKEIRSILNAYQQLDHSVERAALATVARVEGSSYRRTGARMLVLDSGRFFGGISGGCLEGDALRRAQKAIAFNAPSVITYDTTQEDGHQVGVGLGCNGIIDVLITPLDPQDPNNAVLLLSSILDTRVPTVVLSITGGPAEWLGKVFLYSDRETFLDSFPIASVRRELQQDIDLALASETSAGKTYAMGDSTLSVFIEVILPVQRLNVFGGNYDIYPLIRIAKELGWEVTAVCNLQKADRLLFNLADHLVSSKSEQPVYTDRFTANVLMAHDLQTDLRNFKQLLEGPFGYIGLLGPRKRAQKMFDALEAEGRPLTEVERSRIYAPAGLDIGAATPEEIGLSIIAEIRAHFAGRQGQSLRLREGTIYGNP